MHSSVLERTESDLSKINWLRVVILLLPIVLVPWGRFPLCHTPVRSISVFWDQISFLIVGCVITRFESTFQPQKGIVAFVCDLDGWGFGIREFSGFYATKLGASLAALQKALRGPRFFNPRDRDECGVEVHGCKKQGASYVCAGAPMARFKDIFNII